MTKHLRTILSVALATTVFAAAAEIPAGYYSDLKGKKEGELKTELYNIIHSFTQVSSYSALPSYFAITDVYLESDHWYWWDMYSDTKRYASSFSGLNREHALPKSWWGGSESVSAYVDLFHLYPSDQTANSKKSNYPLGEVDQTTFDNGVSKVGYPVNGQGGGARFVFEPDDEYKGDFARTYFYMATCYQNLSWKYTYMVSQNIYPTLNPWSVSLLMDWHRNDPVSPKEIDRNEAIFNIQNNRNPFIDLPELAEYLWGNKQGEAFSPGTVLPDEPVGDPELIAPVKNMELQFNRVALGMEATTRLLVKGNNLSGSIYNQIWSGDSDMFGTSTENIPAKEACTNDGYWLTITYKPTALGEHESKILFEGSFPGTRSVLLKGECLPMPELSACTALPPTDVLADSYTANWTSPDADNIDYYVVTLTRYTGGKATTEEIISENNYLEITDFAASDQDAYFVQSESLGVRSPESNIIFVDHTGITGVLTQEPLAVASAEGYIRFMCSAPQTGARIYNAAGALYMQIDRVEQNTEVAAAQGVYLIVTDQHPTPLKVIVR